MGEDCLSVNVVAPPHPRRSAPRDGVDLRRRVQHAARRRCRGTPGTRWPAPATSSTCRSTTASARSGFTDVTRYATAGAAVRLQPRDPRPGRGAGVGARQHRGVRRRPRQRHDLRRVGRWDRGDDAAGRARRRAACSTGRSRRAPPRPPPTRRSGPRAGPRSSSGCSAWRRRTPSTPCSGASARRRSSGPGHCSTSGRTRRRPGCSCFAPVVDGEFLPVHPLDAAATGAAHAVPLLIGTNDREGTLFAKIGREPAAHHAGADRPPVRQHGPGRAGPGPRGVPGLPEPRGRGRRRRGPRVLVAEHAGRRGARRQRADVRLPLRPRAAPRAAGGARRDARGGDRARCSARSTRRWPALQTVAGGRAALRAVSAADAGALGALRPARRARPGWPAYDTDRRPTLIIDETDRVEDNPRADRRAAWSGFTDYR